MLSSTYKTFITLSGRRLRRYSSSFFHQPGSIPLAHLTVGQLVDISAERDPDRLFCVIPFENVHKTFAQFKSDVDKLAASFVELGLAPQDKMAICGPNNYQWLLTQFAAAKAGLILVYLNPALKTVEFEYLLKKAECRALVSETTFKTQEFYNMWKELCPEMISSRPGTMKSERLPQLQHVIMSGRNQLPGTWSFEDILTNDGSEARQKLRAVEKSLDPDDPTMILFTSGSTGFPKGATISHFNSVNNALVTGHRLHFQQKKTVLCCQVPLFHIFGGIMGSLTCMAHTRKIVLPSPGFNSIKSLENIASEKCSLLYGSPTMINDFIHTYKLDPEKYDLSSLEATLIGGAPVPEKLFEEWIYVLKKSSSNFKTAYGTTEVGVVNIADHNVAFTKGSPLIKVLDHVQMKVVDGENRVVPWGTEGEICVRGPYTFHGYWGEDEKTREVLDHSRWYHTGDLGVLDHDGYLAIVGRMKDMIIRGGENIYPTEVEDLLRSNPSVQELSVVGVPDERMGEEVCVWVKLKPGFISSEAEFREFFKGKISHFKIPRYVFFLDRFPMTTSGKIQKHKLKDMACERLQIKLK